jgi:transcriptional regulator with XRE-family HTH domain
MRTARLAEKLLHIRDALGLSQNEMIQHLGLEDVLYRSNISGFEVGEREPPLPVLLEYARAAGVSVDALIDDEMNLPNKLPARVKPKNRKPATAPMVKTRPPR